MARPDPLAPCCDDSAAAAPAASFERRDLDAAAALFKTLGDPVRLHLFAQIAATDEVCVCHLRTDVSQPTVSHHLRKLREAGLIDSERRGTWVYYRPTTAGRRAADAVHAVAQPVASAAGRAPRAAG